MQASQFVSVAMLPTTVSQVQSGKKSVLLLLLLDASEHSSCLLSLPSPVLMLTLIPFPINIQEQMVPRCFFRSVLSSSDRKTKLRGKDFLIEKWLDGIGDISLVKSSPSISEEACLVLGFVISLPFLCCSWVTAKQ